MKDYPACFQSPQNACPIFYYITFIHIKNRQSLSTGSVWFPLFYGASWKTSLWFLLYIGSVQSTRRRVKIDQLWICFSFWSNIFKNRLTLFVLLLIFITFMFVFREFFIAFISNKTKPRQMSDFTLSLPILAWIICNAPVLVF